MRWIYGTKTKKWEKVGKNDRDYIHGFSDMEFKILGKEKAKKKYLGGNLI